MPIILLNEARVNNREEVLAFSTNSYLNVIILLKVFRALDKREYLMIIGKFLLLLHKNICCDPSSEPSH